MPLWRRSLARTKRGGSGSKATARPRPPDKRPTLQGAVRSAVDAWVVERCGARDADEALAVVVEAVDLVIALEDLAECGWLSVLQAVREAATDALAERTP